VCDGRTERRTDGIGVAYTRYIIYAVACKKTPKRLVGAYARVPAFSWVYCQPASHSSSTQLKIWELTSQPKRQYPADEKLTLTLSTPWMQAYLGTIVCKFGGDPVICLREEAIRWFIGRKIAKVASSYPPQSQKSPSLGATPFEFRDEPDICRN